MKIRMSTIDNVVRKGDWVLDSFSSSIPKYAYKVYNVSGGKFTFWWKDKEYEISYPIERFKKITFGLPKIQYLTGNEP